MTEFRAERCGKPVGLSGHPCMRVPGHRPPCLSGLDTDVITPTNVISPYPKMLFNSLYGTRQYIPRKVIVAAILCGLLTVLQIAWDVYTLAR